VIFAPARTKAIAGFLEGGLKLVGRQSLGRHLRRRFALAFSPNRAGHPPDDEAQESEADSIQLCRGRSGKFAG